MASENAQAILAEEILADARRHGERLLKEARAEAEKTLARARAVAQAETEKTLAKAHERARQRGEMVVRAAGQELARRKLQAREEIVREVLAEAERRLAASSGAAYRQTIARLAAAAARELPADEVVLRVGGGGEKLAAAALDAEIHDALAGDGRNTRLRIELEPSAPRGVVAESADGRLRWDNTFAARLRRQHAALRRLLAPLLFEEL